MTAMTLHDKILIILTIASAVAVAAGLIAIRLWAENVAAGV